MLFRSRVLVDARPENDERETKSILEQENFSGNPGNLSPWIMKLLKNSGTLRLFQDVLLEGLVAKEDRGNFINVISKASYFDAKDEEGKLAVSTEDAIRGQNLGDLPVKIIARGLPQDYKSFGFSEEGGKKLEEIWQNGQRGMLSISSNSELIVAKKSGHMIIHDEPELVVNAIRSLFD